MAIHIYTTREVEKIRAAGEIAFETHIYLKEFIKEGITTKELNDMAEKFIRRKKAYPAFLGFQGYPAAVCTSVNDSVVHEIPHKNKVLKNGDIIGIDIGVKYNNYYADTAWTWPVGKISEKAEKLIKVTSKSLYKGIQAAKQENRIGAIGEAIQKHAESVGFSVVRSLVGHGVGRSIHEEPQVPNYGKKKDGIKIRTGMVLAIEPMINEGNHEIYTENDDWTVKTKDGSLSAHFEHTIAVTSNGPTICTLPSGVSIDVLEKHIA
ncbi:MAG: type I methionyl aminopeptidase [Spirochaetia bacterium]|nr:type I methionyl aminopeptidase [Spirochaetia bacterium]